MPIRNSCGLMHIQALMAPSLDAQIVDAESAFELKMAILDGLIGFPQDKLLPRHDEDMPYCLTRNDNFII